MHAPLSVICRKSVFSHRAYLCSSYDFYI